MAIYDSGTRDEVKIAKQRMKDMKDPKIVAHQYMEEYLYSRNSSGALLNPTNRNDLASYINRNPNKQAVIIKALMFNMSIAKRRIDAMKERNFMANLIMVLLAFVLTVSLIIQ